MERTISNLDLIEDLLLKKKKKKSLVEDHQNLEKSHNPFLY